MNNTNGFPEAAYDIFYFFRKFFLSKVRTRGPTKYVCIQ